MGSWFRALLGPSSALFANLFNTMPSKRVELARAANTAVKSYYDAFFTCEYTGTVLTSFLLTHFKSVLDQGIEHKWTRDAYLHLLLVSKPSREVVTAHNEFAENNIHGLKPIAVESLDFPQIDKALGIQSPVSLAESPTNGQQHRQLLWGIVAGLFFVAGILLWPMHALERPVRKEPLFVPVQLDLSEPVIVPRVVVPDEKRAREMLHPKKSRKAKPQVRRAYALAQSEPEVVQPDASSAQALGTPFKSYETEVKRECPTGQKVSVLLNGTSGVRDTDPNYAALTAAAHNALDRQCERLRAANLSSP